MYLESFLALVQDASLYLLTSLEGGFLLGEAYSVSVGAYARRKFCSPQDSPLRESEIDTFMCQCSFIFNIVFV